MALVRAYRRQSAGPAPVGGNNVAVTGWPDAEGNADATLASTAPTVVSDALGDGTGPGAQSAGQLGFVAGGLVGGTTWAQGCAFRWTANSGFRNVLGDDVSTSFALYANGGSLILDDGSNSATAIATINANTTYLCGIERSASGYLVYLDDMASIGATPTQVYDSSADGSWTGAPSTTPTFGMGAYGGSGAGITGVHLAWLIGDASSDYTNTIFSELREEVSPTTEQTLTGTATLTASAAIPTSGSIANGTAQSLTGASTLTAAAGIPSGGSVATVGGQSLTGTATLTASAAIPTGGSVAVSAAQTLTGIATLTASASIPSGGSVANVAPSGLDDDFAGSGALTSYTTINASSLSDVTQGAGTGSSSYRAAVTGQTNNTTAHFDALYGRFDGRAVTGDFIAIYHNVRVRTPSSDTTAPTVSGEYIFAGVQVQTDLLNPTDLYIQATVGNRGPATGSDGGQTLELKITQSGNSTVIDIGPDAVIGMALDLWVERRNGVIVFRWRTVGGSTWSADLAMPAGTYTLPATVYVGPVTYAFGHFGPDFAGYIDQVEQVPVAQTLTGTATLTAAASIPSGGSVASGPALQLSNSSPLVAGAAIPSGGSIASGPAQSLTGAATLTAAAGIPPGGSITSGPALALVGSATLTAAATIPAGGSLAKAIQLTGGATLTAAASIPTGGSIANDNALQLTGGVTLAATASIPSGGSITSGNPQTVPDVLTGTILPTTVLTSGVAI